MEFHTCCTNGCIHAVLRQRSSYECYTEKAEYAQQHPVTSTTINPAFLIRVQFRIQACGTGGACSPQQWQRIDCSAIWGVLVPTHSNWHELDTARVVSTARILRIHGMIEALSGDGVFRYPALPPGTALYH